MKVFLKKIEQINFGLMSPEDIRKMSTVRVEYPDTYGDDGFPIEKGLMDPCLGVIDPSLICRTCGLEGGECPGHFGSIELARPVVHVGFGDVIHKLLRSTCNECGRILLSDEQIKYFTKKISQAIQNKESINSLLKEVYKLSRRELKTMQEYGEKVDLKYCCPHCGKPQEPILLDMPTTIRQGDYKLTPAEVRERLQKITDGDAFILGVNAKVARPEWLVLTVLPVPPVTVRPSITIETGERAEDDLTHKLVDILRINQRLLENMEAGAPQLIVEDLWELLQYHVTTYFDNDAAGVPPARHRSGRPLITLMQRLMGHEKDRIHDKSRGRFRENLAGKRVNFSGRTVMSPDPNIGINEVGIPQMLAKELTIPIQVNEWNIEEMKNYIRNGPDVHPGAAYVIRNDGRKIRIRNNVNIDFILKQLEPGFIVERHLVDGDVVLLNRHPSLHKLSMLAHKVKILPFKTFRINPAVCPPYNVDFDGDEMNIHVLQNEQSRAEAKSLMLVENNMRSPRFGRPIIGAIRDHISGAYLLTKTGTTFTEEEALQIIRKSGLEMPIFDNGNWILKHNGDYYKEDGALWTGKELFSLTLPNDLNISFSAEISKSSHVHPHEDGYVVIKEGILIQGVIDETAFGSMKGKILDKILSDYGSKQAKEFLEKSIRLSLCALTKMGITNSITDYEIPKEAHNKIEEYLDEKMIEVDELVESYMKEIHKTSQNIFLDKTLDFKISQVLNDARDYAGSIAEMHFRLPNENLSFSSFGRHSYVMAHTGAKSSMLNITQISACVGLQSIRGQSLGKIFNKRGYEKRILPHFKKGELDSKSIGFVKSSFLKGLDPIEYFLHSMAGRDTMADKYIRVKYSGYMQRRLVNALQDLHTDKNGLVKDARGNVIQMLYGEDGVDPVKSDFGKAADLYNLIDEIRIVNGEEIMHTEDDFNNDEPDDDSYAHLSKKEIRKLQIRSDYLSNKMKQTIKSYSNSILELKHVLKQITDDDVNNLKSMINQLESIRRDLIYYQDKYNNFKSLDEMSEKIKNADNDLKIIKRNFKQEYIKIFYHKHKILKEKFVEYDQLLLKLKSITDSELDVFSRLNTELKNLIENTSEFSEYTDKNGLLKNLEDINTEFEDKYANLKSIKNILDNKNFTGFVSVQQADNEIHILNEFMDELKQSSSSYFEEKIISQEKVYQSLLSSNDKISTGNVEKLLVECEKYFTRPMFKRQLKKYNLDDDELDIIKNDFINDIINQKIDENDNIKNLIKKRCEEFRKNNPEFDVNGIDNILENITFTDIDEEIVDKCKNKVKKDYLDGNITLNQVELKLNNYINKKINESKQLKELETIKNDKNVPSIKIHLTNEDMNEIYINVENEIFSEYGIRGKVVNRVNFWTKKKIRKNQSEARNRLNVIKRDFTNLTQLDTKQQAEFVNQIEYYINNHQIKYFDITEENIIKLSVNFIKNGQIKLR